MRVAVFTDSLHPCGVREVVLILVRALRNAGWLLTFCGAAYPGEQANEFETLACHWLKSVCISKTGMRISLFFLPTVALAIGSTVWSADLIIIESNSLTGAWAILWTWVFNLVSPITRQPRKKILFHAHTQADEYVRHFLLIGRLLAGFVNLALRYILNRVDECICPTEFFAEMLKKRLHLRKKPLVWTSPLNIPKKLRKRQLKSLYRGGDRKIPLGWKILLCNGRIGKEKGTEELLAVFGLMYAMGWRGGLVFIGGGNVRKYRRMADALPNGAGRYVSFFGKVSHRRLLELTAAGSDKERAEKVLGVSLSCTDTQGLTIHEQWWLAISVAVLGYTCFSDDIERCGGGAVLPSARKECAQALIDYVEDTTRRREHGRKGQAYILNTLCDENCTKNLVQICADAACLLKAA